MHHWFQYIAHDCLLPKGLKLTSHSILHEPQHECDTSATLITEI